MSLIRGSVGTQLHYYPPIILPLRLVPVARPFPLPSDCSNAVLVPLVLGLPSTTLTPSRLAGSVTSVFCVFPVGKVFTIPSSPTIPSIILLILVSLLVIWLHPTFFAPLSEPNSDPCVVRLVVCCTSRAICVQPGWPALVRRPPARLHRRPRGLAPLHVSFPRP